MKSEKDTILASEDTIKKWVFMLNKFFYENKITPPIACTLFITSLTRKFIEIGLDKKDIIFKLSNLIDLLKGSDNTSEKE